MAKDSDVVVLSYEDVLKNKAENTAIPNKVSNEKQVGLDSEVAHSPEDNDSDESDSDSPMTNISGQPKSGRFWKGKKTRFRTMIKTPGLAMKSLEKKLALRDELKRSKEKSRAIVAERVEAKEAKKQRRRDNIKRTEENRKKAEIVQVIKNSTKLKKMKKKQLRNIEKRDTTNLK